MIERLARFVEQAGIRPTVDRVFKFGEARDACPVFWSEGHGGYWAAAGYDAVTRIARDWETFSSEKVWDPATGHHAGGNTVPSFPGPGFIPVESDPPRWKK